MISSSGDDANTGLIDSSTAMRSYLNILNDESTNINLSTVRSLALKTITHPQIFCGFDQLKTCCFSGGQNSTTVNASNSILNTLDLFSFGTVKDYQKQDGANEYYLPLNEPALAKLRQLTVMTCVQEICLAGKTSISYHDVGEALGMTTDLMDYGNPTFDCTATTRITRDVENVLVQCLYSNVLKGKLCQKTRTFGWKNECLPVVSSRDVRLTHVPDLLLQLRGLETRLEESGIEVSHAQKNVSRGLENAAQYWKSIRKTKKKTQEEYMSKSGGGTDGGSGTSAARAFFGEIVGGASINNPRRSSKRSRGGMSGNYQLDSGKRI